LTNNDFTEKEKGMATIQHVKHTPPACALNADRFAMLPPLLLEWIYLHIFHKNL